MICINNLRHHFQDFSKMQKVIHFSRMELLAKTLIFPQGWRQIVKKQMLGGASIITTTDIPNNLIFPPEIIIHIRQYLGVADILLLSMAFKAFKHLRGKSKRNIFKHTGDFEDFLFLDACENGYDNLVQSYLKRRYEVNSTIVTAAILNGKLSILEKIADKRGFDSFPFKISVLAANFGYFDIVKWAHSKSEHLNPHLKRGIVMLDIDDVCAAAATGGYIDIVDWAIQNNYPTDEKVMASAALYGQVEMVMWGLEHGLLYDESLCEGAARASKKIGINLLKTLHEYGCPWDALTLSGLAQSENIEGLIWAREQGCPWDSRVCAMAASLENLEVLKWLRENGCPWDEIVCTVAADSGQLKTLQWLRENGCPWNEETFICACQNGNLKMVIWCKENGAPMDMENEDIIRTALNNEHFEIFNWLDENGFASPDDILLDAYCIGKIDFFKKLFKTGSYNVEPSLINFIAEADDIELFKWMVENGFKLNEEYMTEIASTDNIEMFIWCVETLGAKYNFNNVLDAVRENFNDEFELYIRVNNLDEKNENSE